MKKLLLAPLLMAAVFTIFSCQKMELNPATKVEDSNLETRKVDGCLPTEVILVAGQHINAGTVTVTNDLDFIYVTYTTANGWLLTQTHLYVGDCALIPVTNTGNPVPGQFPYAGTHNNITTYTYQVPIALIPVEGCGCIAAHAVVVKLNASGQVIDQQTGWGEGIRINPNGGNWGMKFDYCNCIPDL